MGELKEENPHCAQVIQPGLDKLNDYTVDLDLVPAYQIAMGIFFIFFYDNLAFISRYSSGPSK